jgi:hypothetical protein
MDTSYGLRGEIAPKGALGEFGETFKSGPFEISLNAGLLEIGFEDPALSDQARELARQYLAATAFVRGQHLAIDLNMSWAKNSSGGKDISLSVFEVLNVTAELGAVTTSVDITGKAAIVKTFDSRSLASQQDLVSKAGKDPALNSALQYFNEEVANHDRPLYGIYKALEALTKALGHNGRAMLGAFAGKSKKYVDDVMQTAQTTRHHKPSNAKSLLTESECRDGQRLA